MDRKSSSAVVAEMPSRQSYDQDAITATPGRSPGDTPYLQEKSAIASTTGFANPNEPRYFHSRRVRKGEVEKPWMNKKDPKERIIYWIPIVGIVIGVIAAGVIVWDGLTTVTNYNYCSILDEDFTNGLDSTIWSKEVEVGGYGFVDPLDFY